MKIAESIEEFRALRRALTGTVGFVPTMGALHSAHVSLFEQANQRADHLVVSIFVNPTQFDRAEDLDSYPSDREGDLQKCRDAGAEIVFYPTPTMMYGNGRDQLTYVEVHELDNYLCGATRPGHFRGVSTVVTKLFNIVQPDVAVFGQKDYQQLAIIRQMTEDLNFPIEIIGAATAREDDGLAVSSRNYNIPADKREAAASLNRAMGRVWVKYREGARDRAALAEDIRAGVETAGLRLDYVDFVDAKTLQTPADGPLPGEGLVLAAAAFVGQVRIIDNLVLDDELPPKIDLSAK